MRTIGERLARTEATVEEGLTQRARMIDQLDRIEQNQLAQVAVAGRVDRLEDRQDQHEVILDDLVAKKNRAMVAATLLGVIGGSVATFIAKKLTFFS